jgi:hypothetical protein
MATISVRGVGRCPVRGSTLRRPERLDGGRARSERLWSDMAQMVVAVRARND